MLTDIISRYSDPQICLKPETLRFSYIFLTMLIDRQMDSSKGTSTNLLFDLILVYPMNGSSTIILTICVFRACM